MDQINRIGTSKGQSYIYYISVAVSYLLRKEFDICLSNASATWIYSAFEIEMIISTRPLFEANPIARTVEK